MDRFEIAASTRLVFGWGVVDRLPGLVEGLGDSAMIVCGRESAKRAGHLATVVGLLQSRGIRVEVFDRIAANPDCAIVDEGAQLAREREVRVIIGLGGGSALDAAKGIAIAAIGRRPVRDHIWDGAPLPATKLPLVAVPTTAGTGSELSRGAILSDASTGRKSGLRGELCLPTWAVVDPELTVTMPRHVSAATGFDAWSHALESFLSRKANPFTEALSIEAMGRIVECLPRVLEDGGDRDARTGMAAASTMAGWNLGVATTCLPHRLQYPVGARTGTVHARGIAALHVAWLRQTEAFATEKLARVCRILAPRYGRAAGTRTNCAELERAFISDVGMTTRLGDLGIDASQCDGLTAEVTGDLASDPGPHDAASLSSLYHHSL